jgi:phosphoribosylamine-glycine ligase
MSKCLVIDHGLFTAFAERLAEEHEVRYFVPYADRSFPIPGPAFIGEGLKGIERVNNWEENLDVDFVVIPDVGFMYLAEHIRSFGIPVWAAGMGEKLEVQRWRAKETMKELGLPVGKTALVTGMPALREYLENNKNVFVKISGFRGVAETFSSPSWEHSQQRVNELWDALGGLCNVFPFVVEHMVESVVEAGYDGYCIDGNFPSTCLTGVEVKDCGYVGCVRDYADLSEPVKVVNQKLMPFLEEAQYRQWFSTEIRVTEEGTPYLIDLTTRCPAPPSALVWEMVDNVGEIVEAGANGVLVDPVWRAKYGALAIIKSASAEEKWCPVSVDPKIERWVKWRNACVVDGMTYIVPTTGVRMCEIGDCIGIGDTMEEAILACQNHAEGVKGFDLKVNTDALPAALKEIENAEDNGIIFTDEELPKQSDLLD